MQDLESKRKRIETVVKILAFLVVGFIVAPFIFISIQGLIGLIAASAISFVAINFIPWFGAKVANWRLKAIKHEAAQNPIETLQNDYNSRIGALQAFRTSIRDFAGEVGTFKDKLVDFKKQYPNEAAKFDEQYNQMVTLLELRKSKYQEAKGNLSLYEGEIGKATAIWEMAQAAAKMNKAAGVDADEFFAKIQVETALDSVQKSLNSAFADLEISLLDENGKKAEMVNVSPAQAALPEATHPMDGLELDIENVPHKVRA